MTATHAHVRLPQGHMVIHSNVIARLRAVIEADHADGLLSDLDYESLEASIAKAEEHTMELLLAGGVE